MSAIAEDTLRDAESVPGYRLLEVVDRRPEVGVTYRACDLRRNAPVELTVVDAVLSRNARYRERFERRRRLLSSLRHPALVPLLDAGESRHGLFVVAESPVGVPLRSMLERGPVTPARALAILAPVADLLDRLHAGRLSAGDLSTRRIVVGDGDRAMVAGPGLAGISLLASARLEVSSDALEYASPEQLRGLAADARSDVYGLAAIFYEAITGRPLFANATPDAATGLPMRAVLARRALPAPAVGIRHTRVGNQFDGVLKAALSEPPAARPASPGLLVERLRQALETGGSPEPHPAGDARPRRRSSSPVAEAPGVATPSAARREGPRRHPAPAAQPATAATPGPDRAAAQRSRKAVGNPRRRVRAARPTLHDMRGIAPATAAAMVAGLILALAGDEPARTDGPSLGTRQASAGMLQVSHPSTWEPERVRSGAGPLSLTTPIAIVPGPGMEAQPHSRLVAGMATVTGASLLSPQLERSLGRRAKPDAVLLGGHEALRYRDVALPGRHLRSTVYAVPTSAGVATIACFSPRFVDTLDGQCEAMATTLELSGADPLPLGPNAAYGRLITRLVDRVDVARRRGRAQLGYAKRAPGQGRRAADLAMVFRRAAARLAASGPRAGTADVHRELVGALRDVRNAYEALATAAARGDRPGYNAARRLVGKREAALSRVLQGMGRLGYVVRRR